MSDPPTHVNGHLSPDMFIYFFKGERGSLGGRGQPGLTGLKGAKVRELVCGRIQLENDLCVPFKSVVAWYAVFICLVIQPSAKFTSVNSI